MTAKLRKSAKERECQIRTPYCNFDSATTVLCHLPGGGMGAKMSDIHAAYGCSACHDLVDGRVTSRNYDRAQTMLWFYQGVIRTQEIMIKENLIKI